MHEHFADWHHRGSFAVSAEQLAARWSALQTVLDKTATTPERRLEMVRIAHQQDADAEIHDSLETNLQSGDALFPMADNAFLLGIVVSAALIDRFESKPDAATTAAALGVRSATALGWSPALDELPAAANDYLLREAQRIRPTEPAAAGDVVGPVKKSIAPVTAQTSQGASAPAAELGAALDSIAAGLNGLQTAARGDGAIVASLREQLNILWWLFGEQCYCMETSFADIAPAAAPLVLAVDLAALTERVPAPRASRAFLLKALRLVSAAAEEVAAADAINSTPREVRMRVAIPAQERARVFTPVAELIRRSLETTNKNDWVASGMGATGFAAKSKVAPVDLAERLYEEQLLTRLID
jgi:GTPase-associated system helical domain